MRARSRRPRRLPAFVASLSVVALVLAWPVSPVLAADPRLEEAQERRIEVQSRLDELLQRIADLEREASDTQAELADLEATVAAQGAAAEVAGDALAAHLREAYMHGTADPTLTLLASGSAREATEQVRMLGMLGRSERGELESVRSARVRTEATADLVEQAATELAERQAELDVARAEVGTLLAQAEAEELDVRNTLAAEEAVRIAAERAAAQRASRQAATAARAGAELAAADQDDSADDTGAADGDDDTASATDTGGDDTTGDDDASAGDDAEESDGDDGGGGSAGSAAPVSGGVACPIGNPRSFSDTYGAPRSGGRSHKGVDMLAPHGTPIYAYESGTISRMNGNRLGGISLYLQGASGNVYYYTHLSGYVGGLSAGQSVSVGQQIAFNGDTGNAAGIPHLHFEVMPGGGGNVNPYPYASRACG